MEEDTSLRRYLYKKILTEKPKNAKLEKDVIKKIYSDYLRYGLITVDLELKKFE